MDDEGIEPAGAAGRIGVLGGDGLWSVAQVLRGAGVAVLDMEPGPKHGAEAICAAWHYGLSSVRAGLMGHPRAALQLIAQSQGSLPKGWAWKGSDGLYIDGLRPGIDPEGLPKDQIEPYRLAHLAALARLVAGADRLILPLCTARAFVDGAGTVFGAKPRGVTLPTGVKLSQIEFDPKDMADDLQALGEALAALNPRLSLQACILPSLSDQPGDAALLQQALGLSGLAHDPVLDAVLESMARGQGGSALLAHLVQGGALDDFGAVAPAAAPEAKPDRKANRKDNSARREARKAKKAQGGDGARVICEDELLEAFSK